MGRETRGLDLWGENPGVFFWHLVGVVSEAQRNRSLRCLMSCQEVLRSVWVDVWVEIKDDFVKRSRGVPGSPIWTSTLRTPSPFLLIVE